jgi:hypothetical protein
MNDASIDVWIKALTGSAGAVVAMGLWVRSLIQQTRELGAIIEKKDTRINEISDKAVEALTTLSIVAKTDREWKDEVAKQIGEIHRLVENSTP